MPRPRPLTPSEAKSSLAHRLGTRLAPRLRQLATRFGIRSQRVFLTWVRWSGGERGAGRVLEVARVELLPTPKVSDMTAMSFNPYFGGVLPVGAQRISRISVAYTYDALVGKMVPGEEKGQPVPEDWDFFYELVEDGRGDDPPERKRFRLLGVPWRREDWVEWSLLLERAAEDMGRDGMPQLGPDD